MPKPGPVVTVFAGRPWTKLQVVNLSRVLVCLFNVVAVGSLFLTPPTVLLSILDSLIRGYVLFLCTVIAHEGTHGHLGRSRRVNTFWAQLALLPNMVPYSSFRKTHHLHHAHTNESGMDPDTFLHAPLWQLPFRAVAMPHYWLVWLHKRGKIHRRDALEILVAYVLIVLVYAPVIATVGLARVAAGVGPALVIASLLLWYPFAYRVHEGFSTGAAETRTHSYHGKFLFWLSLGLSTHRIHHERPGRTWLELRDSITRSPHRFPKSVTALRDTISPDG